MHHIQPILIEPEGHDINKNHAAPGIRSNEDVFDQAASSIHFPKSDAANTLPLFRVVNVNVNGVVKRIRYPFGASMEKTVTVPKAAQRSPPTTHENTDALKIASIGPVPSNTTTSKGEVANGNRLDNQLSLQVFSSAGKVTLQGGFLHLKSNQVNYPVQRTILNSQSIETSTSAHVMELNVHKNPVSNGNAHVITLPGCLKFNKSTGVECSNSVFQTQVTTATLPGARTVQIPNKLINTTIQDQNRNSNLHFYSSSQETSPSLSQATALVMEQNRTRLGPKRVIEIIPTAQYIVPVKVGYNSAPVVTRISHAQLPGSSQSNFLCIPSKSASLHRIKPVHAKENDCISLILEPAPSQRQMSTSLNACSTNSSVSNPLRYSTCYSKSVKDNPQLQQTDRLSLNSTTTPINCSSLEANSIRYSSDQLSLQKSKSTIKRSASISDKQHDEHDEDRQNLSKLLLNLLHMSKRMDMTSDSQGVTVGDTDGESMSATSPLNSDQYGVRYALQRKKSCTDWSGIQVSKRGVKERRTLFEKYKKDIPGLKDCAVDVFRLNSLDSNNKTVYLKNLTPRLESILKLEEANARNKISRRQRKDGDITNGRYAMITTRSSSYLIPADCDVTKPAMVMVNQSTIADETSNDAQVRVIQNWLPGALFDSSDLKQVIFTASRLSKSSPSTVHSNQVAACAYPKTPSKKANVYSNDTSFTNQHILIARKRKFENISRNVKISTADRIKQLKARFDRMNESASHQTRAVLQHSKDVLRSLDEDM